MDTFLQGLFDLSSIIDATIHFRPASKWLPHLPILKQHDIIGKQIYLHFCFWDRPRRFLANRRDRCSIRQ